MKKAKTGLGIFLAVVLIGSFFLSPAHAQNYPDLSMWLNQWFKVSLMLRVLHFSNIGVPPDPGQDVGRGTAYLVCTSLTPTPFNPNISPVLSCDIFVQNEAGDWQFEDFSFNYVGGDVSNFAGWSTIASATFENAFTVQIKGTKKKDGTLTGATIKTLGGYTWEIDDVPGFTGRWVGTLNFKGTWVNPATLCKSGKNPTLPPCAVILP